MTINKVSLIIRGLLGAVWGLAAVILAFVFEAWLPVLSTLFYPLIFAGAVPTAVLFSGMRVTFRRALFTGLISGFIYLLLSPVFPLLASILAGASLGGGLAKNSDEPGALSGLIMNTLKGALVLPLIILTGSMISGSLYMVTGAPLYHWLFWGFWSVVGVMLIRGRANEDRDQELETPSRSALDDFRSEAKEIAREISELSIRLDR